MANNYALSGPLDKLERRLDKLFGKEIESGADVKAARKNKEAIQKNSKQKTTKQINNQPCDSKRGIADKLEGSLDKLFGQEVSTMTDAKCSSNTNQVKRNTNSIKNFSYKNEKPSAFSALNKFESNYKSSEHAWTSMVELHFRPSVVRSEFPSGCLAFVVDAVFDWSEVRDQSGVRIGNEQVVERAGHKNLSRLFTHDGVLHE